jgi:hypothetical protein
LFNWGNFEGANKITSYFGPNWQLDTEQKKRITTINWPADLAAIPDAAFQDFTSLTEITIPNEVMTIGNHAFQGCTGLASLTIPGKVTSVGSNAFYGCTGLTSMTIPSNVTTIRWAAFGGCTGLTSMTIPVTVTELEGGVLSGCTGLISATLPSNLAVLKSNFFEGCNRLTNFTIPSGVTKIENSALRGCSSLTSLAIPNSVTEIQNEAFAGCTGLTSMTFPKSVKIFGDSVLRNCKGLTSLTIENMSLTTQPWNMVRIDDGDGSYGATFPKGLTHYSGPTDWMWPELKANITSVTISPEITKIPVGAFNGFTSLAGVTIPNTITAIGDGAFNGCTSLTGLTIPTSVKSIGSNAFYNCTGLTSMTIPNSVTSLGADAFSGTQIANFTYPEALLGRLSAAGLPGSLTTDLLIDGIANKLANSEDFINKLAATIMAKTGHFGFATQGQLSNIMTDSLAQGVNSVLNSPNSYSLYTADQIQNMAIGDLVLTREVNGNFVLNYDIEQSNDLQSWTVYSANTQIVKLPADKAFVRIKAKQ